MKTGEYKLDNEMVEKIIRNFNRVGRTVNAEAVRNEAAYFTGGFDSSTDCAEMFKAVIWNKGFVR